MADPTNFLQLANVGRRYGNVTALESCDLEIRRGEFVTLLGPSGCGKTTTLRMVAGFVRPSTGTISLNGRVLSSDTIFVPPEKRGIGMVFQSYAVWPHMSVRANVALPLKLRRLPRGEITRLTDEVLQLCRLEKFADRDPHQLSGGQLQRVALARALVYKPELILLDEPLSNLDVSLREELRHELHLLHKATQATFVLVTHDQVEAMSLSDRVAVMREGKVEQIGAPQEIYRSPRTEFVAQFVGAANILSGTVDDALPSGDRFRWVVRVGSLILNVRALHAVRKGTSIRLAVHPEAVRLGDTVSNIGGDNTFTGLVKSAYFLGRTQEAMIEVGGMELRAVQVRGQQSIEGQSVSVSIAADAIIALTLDGAPASQNQLSALPLQVPSARHAIG